MRQSPPVEGRGTLLATGIFFLVCGAVLTALCYLAMRVIAHTLLPASGADESWIAHVIAGVFTLAGFLAARSTTDDYWRSPEFDTTDPDNRLSNISIHGRGGHHWNVIPTTPRSIGGCTRIIALPLTIGPRLILTGAGELWRAARGS